ncbi:MULTISPECIES: hypothetical protein [unclassified Streptomyces]|uniref:hypothetical protein n=1 Tax=unclassified Streptomyces TaxID=2593676 RepID=UPI0036C0216E
MSDHVAPNTTLAAAATFTAAGHACAARAGRPALAVASALATTVWAYDLRLKHTAAGRAPMAAARGLDLLLGATATTTARRRHTGTAGSEEPSPGTRTAATALRHSPRTPAPSPRCPGTRPGERRGDLSAHARD